LIAQRLGGRRGCGVDHFDFHTVEKRGLRIFRMFAVRVISP